jgi:hypothetical protein
MSLFSATFAGVTASTTQDMKTVITTATGQGSVVKVYEIYVAGEAGSSTVQRLQVNRPTAVGVTIGANTQTPEKVDPASVASAFTLAGSISAVSSWTTPPVASTNDILTIGLNAFGGVVRWVAPPGSEVVVGSQGAIAHLIALRSRSGTAALSGHILISEN